MRDLTPEECEFIAGGDGYNPSNPEFPPDIVVVASPPPYSSPPYSPPFQPPTPPSPPPFFDPGSGGGGGNGSHPSPSDFQLTDVNAPDVENFSRAVTYLEDSPIANEILKQALAKGAVIHIIHDGNDRATVGGTDVWWDPNSALITTDGREQSAALGLIHELEHLFGNPAAVQNTGNAYDTTEEQRVIDNYETPIANQLGEGTRTDHRGSTVVEAYSNTHS